MTHRHVKLDPASIEQIENIFDVVIDFMGEHWVATNVNVGKDPTGPISCSINCTDAAGNMVTYSERVVGPRVRLSPQAANLGPGETVQFIATVTDVDGSDIPYPEITWTVRPQANGGGSIDASGFYEAPPVIPGSGADVIEALFEQSGSMATATVSLHP